MREMLKEMVKCTLISMGMSMGIFCFVGMVFDIYFGGNFTLANYQFTKMVIGCVLVGLGFGIPSLIYHKENLPMPFKIIVHMGIGCVVYTLVAHAVGWTYGSTTWAQEAMIIAVQLFVAFLIWFVFMQHYRREAREMNDKIQTLKG